eukprot:1285507-Pleurochrysis_carterae.AAC.1
MSSGGWHADGAVRRLRSATALCVRRRVRTFGMLWSTWLAARMACVHASGRDGSARTEACCARSG